MTFIIEVIGRSLCYVLFVNSKGAVPMACSILIDKPSTGHREGAGTSLMRV